MGVAPRIYCPLDLYEITGKGVGICIKVVVAPQPDGKQFASHLRSAGLPSYQENLVSACNERLVRLGTPLET